jgi:hypothetical protein
MLKNQNTKNSALFDDSTSHINTSSNNSNIVHKQTATSTVSNDNKKLLKSEKQSLLVKNGIAISRRHKELRESELSGVRNKELRTELRDLNKTRRVIQRTATT